MVERDLAKVEVASSNLVSRSSYKKRHLPGGVFAFTPFMAATRKCPSTDDAFRQAMADSLSGRQVLSCIGLVPAGGNYKTVHSRIQQLGLDTSHFAGKEWNTGARFRMLGPPFLGKAF